MVNYKGRLAIEDDEFNERLRQKPHDSRLTSHDFITNFNDYELVSR
jgi:hypothetical protein